jgi:RNA polymerase sigma-70 factor, ECF subfamily
MRTMPRDTREQSLVEAFQSARPALTKRAQSIVRNRSDAEDVVQEAAVRAWQARERFRFGADPLPWLRAIVTRTALDATRERKRRSRLVAEEPIRLDSSPEERAVRTETLATIVDAASILSPASRRVLFLHDLDGMTSQEIAQLDNLPYHTVRTRLRRARISLRNQLKEAV